MLAMAKVIVVGGGLAGLCASIEALRAGASVFLLDKSKSVGGNSAKATSGINGVLTNYQIAANIQDTLADFQKDTLSSGEGLSDTALVDVLVNHSKDAVDFLSSFGLNLSAISQCGGHSHPRTHREPPMADGKPAPVGWDIIKTLSGHLNTGYPGMFNLITEARATDFIIQDEKVVGVSYEAHGEKKEIRGDAVVMATGGFCCDRSEDSLLVEYAPKKSKLATTNGPFAVGDGIRMGRRINAKLVDMDKIQIHPTGFVDPKDPLNPVKFLGPEALRGCGGILLNPKGERFVNELGRRDHVSEKIFAQFPGGIENVPPATATIVMNDEAVLNFGKAAWEFYAKVKQFGHTVQGAAGLAQHMGVPEETIKQVFADYRAAASGEKPDAFGKKVFPITFKDDETLHICTITPVLHYSMGGMKINPHAQILREVNQTTQVIPGLYGAGEVTGGVHGENRLAGNSLLECVVFGRIAGKNAAAIASNL